MNKALVEVQLHSDDRITHSILSREVFSRLFTRLRDEKPPYVLSLRQRQKGHSKGLLTLVHCIDDLSHLDSKFHSLSTNRSILIPHRFARAHGLQPGETVQVQRLREDVLALTQVILMATTHEGYLAVTEGVSFFHQNLDGRLVSRGDTLNPEIASTVEPRENYVVLDCTPLSQGLIVSRKTVVVVVPPTNPRPASEAVLTSLSSTSQPALSPLLVSSFILNESREFLSTEPKSFLSGKVVTNLSASLFGRMSDSFTSPSLGVGLLSRPLASPSPTADWRDPICEVGTTLATLRCLHVFSGSWVCVENPSTQKRRLARIYALDPPSLPNAPSAMVYHPAVRDAPSYFPGETPLPNVLYLSPALCFNLGIHFEDMEEGTVRLLLSTTVSHATQCASSTMRGLPGKNPSLPYAMASQVRIARVSQPYSSGILSYTRALRSYFRNPRILSLGDIFAVTVKDTSPFGEEEEEEEDEDDSDEEDTNANKLVYFKVIHLQPEGKGNEYYCINRQETTLLQEGVANARVPAFDKPFLVSDDSLVAENRSQKLAWGELKGVVQPCLHELSGLLRITCALILHGPKGAGKSSLVYLAAERFGLHVVQIDCFDLLNPSEVQTEVNLRGAFKDALMHSPCIFFLRSLEAFDKTVGPQDPTRDPSIAKLLRDLILKLQRSTKTVLVMGTVDALEALSPPVRSCFRHEIEVSSPDADARKEMLLRLTDGVPLAMDVSIQEIATKTAAFVQRDLAAMVAHASGLAIARVLESQSTLNRTGENAAYDSEEEEEIVASLSEAGVTICTQDFGQSIHHIQSHHSSSVAAPKIPNVTWDDVGGLARVKEEILDTIQLPLKRPELFSSNLRQRSGVLLYGPPGTGKTLLAKAVATECSLNFMSVKGPELINMYVGESEKNVRDTFTRARNARPCVIFFDELDSLAPNRGVTGDSGGVMDRVVAQLLTELDGMQKSNDVFVIGATNRPDLLDPALLRPGRFDRLLYLGVSEDHESQLKIVQALTRNFHLGETVDLASVVTHCPLTFTGADFYALCSDAMLNAIRERVQEEEKNTASTDRETAPKQGRTVHVEERHFMAALQSITPSVSQADLEHYAQVKRQYSQHNTKGLKTRKKDKRKQEGSEIL